MRIEGEEKFQGEGIDILGKGEFPEEPRVK